MTGSIAPPGLSDLRSFRRIDVVDPAEMGADSRVSRRLPADSTVFSYRLQDRSLLRRRFDSPITRIAMRSIGDLRVCWIEDRFAARIDIGGDGVDRYCISTVLRGRKALVQAGTETSGGPPVGLIYRGAAGTCVLTSDANLRLNVWIQAHTLEAALEGMLGTKLRRPLAFRPAIDWGRGLAASLGGQIDLLLRELGREDGIADNPAAWASCTDMLTHLVLHGLPHNYSDSLGHGRCGAVPAYVRRAEEFMHANAAGPLRMEDVARAAGCSVRTLGAVFSRFRGTTPLAALHAIRLDLVHDELSRRPADLGAAEVARCYGFTNAGRFAAAYRLRFGESASETARCGPHRRMPGR